MPATWSAGTLTKWLPIPKKNLFIPQKSRFQKETALSHVTTEKKLKSQDLFPPLQQFFILLSAGQPGVIDMNRLPWFSQSGAKASYCNLHVFLQIQYFMNLCPVTPTRLWDLPPKIAVMSFLVAHVSCRAWRGGGLTWFSSAFAPKILTQSHWPVRVVPLHNPTQLPTPWSLPLTYSLQSPSLLELCPTHVLIIALNPLMQLFSSQLRHRWTYSLTCKDEQAPL